uniref:F-box domain-containing protein n=1 Tax=Moniliophthora roreri TaxID=221103 RepID=A0A0W0F6K2_MONRR
MLFTHLRILLVGLVFVQTSIAKPPPKQPIGLACRCSSNHFWHNKRTNHVCDTLRQTPRPDPLVSRNDEHGTALCIIPNSVLHSLNKPNEGWEVWWKQKLCKGDGRARQPFRHVQTLYLAIDQITPFHQSPPRPTTLSTQFAGQEGYQAIMSSAALVPQKGVSQRRSVDVSRMYEDFPNEIWTAIFDQLSTPKDLLRCLLTCKRFYSISWPSLNRTIFLNCYTATTRRIMITLNNLPKNSVLPHIVKGMVIRDNFDSMDSESTIDPYITIVSIIQKSFFGTLTSLVFVGAIITPVICPILANLPNLRQLHFYSSSIYAEAQEEAHINLDEDASEASSAETTLPVLPRLREFRLWRNDWYQRSRLRGQTPRALTAGPGYQRTLRVLLQLCMNAHSLHIDWNGAAAQKLACAARNSSLPLRYLCLRMPPLELQIADPKMSGSQVLSLLRWLGQLEELRIIGNGYIHISPARSRSIVIGISQLRAYTGPFELFSTFDETPPLERVTFTFTEDTHPEHKAKIPTVEELCTVFSRLASPKLEELNCYADYWDKELLYCIASCFPGLKTLRIAYADGCIGENEMTSLAALHLIRLPHLKVFHLYHLARPAKVESASLSHIHYHGKTQRETRRLFQEYLRGWLPAPVESTYSDSPIKDSETNELLIAWGHYASSLCEARLTRTAIWTRGNQVDRKWGAWRIPNNHWREVEGDGTFLLTLMDLTPLRQCLSEARRGRSISYASTALFLFDYLLTLCDEIRYMWSKKRALIGVIPFFSSRYTAFVAALLILLPSATSTRIDQVATSKDTPPTTTCGMLKRYAGLRLISVFSSEFIITVRTWAIWERDKKLLWILVVFSVSTFIPGAVIVALGIATRRDLSLLPPEFGNITDCRIMVSDVKEGYIVTYILTIIYESGILTLTSVKITRWRKSIPQTIRAPLLDTLWRDGILYFTWMLALSFVNIALVANGSNLLLQGGSQFQMVFHSILSTRIALHLASSRTPKEISTPGSSVFMSDVHFRTREVSRGTQRLPMPREENIASEDHDDGQPLALEATQA